MNCDRLLRSKDRLTRIAQDRLEHVRQQYLNDPMFRDAVDRADITPETRAVTETLALTRTLAATHFRDAQRAITLNDAIDFLHAVVPPRYCDVVLIDGATCDAVERARRRLPWVRIAETFSGRGNGVERFLAHLEAAAPAPT